MHASKSSERQGGRHLIRVEEELGEDGGMNKTSCASLSGQSVGPLVDEGRLAGA